MTQQFCKAIAKFAIVIGCITGLALLVVGVCLILFPMQALRVAIITVGLLAVTAAFAMIGGTVKSSVELMKTSAKVRLKTNGRA